MNDNTIIGYKLTNADYTCIDFKYEVGKTYDLEGEIILCQNGFHFCKDFYKCFEFYNNIGGDKHLLKIQALGRVITDDDIKFCTDKIKILEEITDIESLIEEHNTSVQQNTCVSEDYVKQYESDWNYITERQRLSEEFIERHTDKMSVLNWYYVSLYQILSEEFIERHLDKIDTIGRYHISKYQKLSLNFIKRHKDKLFLRVLVVHNCKISQEIKQQISTFKEN